MPAPLACVNLFIVYMLFFFFYLWDSAWADMIPLPVPALCRRYGTYEPCEPSLCPSLPLSYLVPVVAAVRAPMPCLCHALMSRTRLPLVYLLMSGIVV